MKIQELESITGLERPSIRFYEKEGLLCPKRLENGYRDYSEADAELLKKIKLLRRLGMSVDKIRQLQEGSTELATVIAQQVSCHTSQIDEHRRCRAVCEAIRDDGAIFASLDAEHYLRLLREIRINDKALERADFQESIPEEIHPWRRWIARWLDYALWGALVNLIWIVILRIRPVITGDLGTALFSICTMAAFVPVEAFLLSKTGTTPGKFIMGIRLEYVQGGKLPYPEALYRSLRVYTGGTGLGIPVVNLILYMLRYCQLTGRSWRILARYDEVEGPQQMPWDEETELIYTERNWKRGVALAVYLSVLIGSTVWCTLDGFRPSFRSNELTISQVAKNYNDTLAVLSQDAQYYDKLQEDGTRKPVSPNTVIFDMNNTSGNNLMQFSYDVRNGYVHSVHIHHSWDSVTYLQPMEGDALTMACSLLLAQEGCGIRELREFVRLYEGHLSSKSVSFTYRNLLVEWELTTELVLHQGTLSPDPDEDGSATLDFRITIQK